MIADLCLCDDVSEFFHLSRRKDGHLLSSQTLSLPAASSSKPVLFRFWSLVEASNLQVTKPVWGLADQHSSGLIFWSAESESINSAAIRWKSWGYHIRALQLAFTRFRIALGEPSAGGAVVGPLRITTRCDFLSPLRRRTF